MSSAPVHGKVVELDDIKAAAKMIKPLLPKTPCMASHFCKHFGMNLFYKLETVHKSANIKERGMLNMLLLYLKEMDMPLDETKPGLLITTLGNSAISLCTYAQGFNVPVTMVIPNFISVTKIRKCKQLGAKVYIHGDSLMEAGVFARALAAEKKIKFIDGRDHHHLLAGYGSLALEIIEELPYVDAIIVSAGCGGVAAMTKKVVSHLKPDCVVYAVEVERSPPVGTGSSDNPLEKPGALKPTVADCIAATHIGVNAAANGYPDALDRLILARDDAIARSILHLFEHERLVVEGAGACPLAAIIDNLVPELKTKTVALVLSGGNIDPTLFPRCLERGLAAEGRLAEFKVQLSDTVHSKTRLFTLLAKAGHNIYRYAEDHRWLENKMHKLQVTIVVHTANLLHALDLKSLMERAYPKNVFFSTYPLYVTLGCTCGGHKFPV